MWNMHKRKQHAAGQGGVNLFGPSNYGNGKRARQFIPPKEPLCRFFLLFFFLSLWFVDLPSSAHHQEEENEEKKHTIRTQDHDG